MTLETKNPKQNDTAFKTHNRNFAEFEFFRHVNFFAIDGPSMGPRWGAVCAADITPGMHHAWAIDGHA